MGLAGCVAAGAPAAAFAQPPAIAPFSRGAPGADPAGWRRLAIPGVKLPEFSLVEDGGRTVLRVRAESAAGSLALDLSADPAATPVLAWRWKIQRAIEGERFGTREGDDFAARVYVTFDVPPAALDLASRVKRALARAMFGDDLPSAALCYVWASREPAGTTAWNPYTDRVRMVVLQSGNGRAGQWVEEARDVDSDFRAAFGSQWPGPTPRITGVLVAADTDQTREQATAWFGDLRLEARR